MDHDVCKVASVVCKKACFGPKKHWTVNPIALVTAELVAKGISQLVSQSVENFMKTTSA